MSTEQSRIAASDAPLTRSGISDQLADMGLQAGDLVLMHTAMGQLGWVCGGDQAVISAVFDVLGSDGTLVMPGFSSQLSDPGTWNSPPVPEDWVEIIRDHMPVFDPDKTPTRGMGRVGESFRKWPGTARSLHPADSFLANGPIATEILADHPKSNSLGEQSPLGKMHRRGAKVLLLGADYRSCTAFHLAETDLPGHEPQQESRPVRRRDGRTEWSSALQPPSFEDRFPEIGAELDAMTDVVTFGFSSSARLFDMKIAVQTARKWMIANLCQTSA